jgi:hypothetical protein
MAKWFTTLVLFATLVGRVLAGVPLHAGEPRCSMPGCCEAAQAAADTPESKAAQFCCAANCPPSDTTTPNRSFQSPSVNIAALHPVEAQPLAAAHADDLRFHATSVYLPDSQLAYLRHLTLLI